MYGISNATLAANNPQLDNSCDIYVGEVLCVDTELYTYPELNVTLYEVSGTPATRRVMLRY
jgi:hypothetical protein